MKRPARLLLIPLLIGCSLCAHGQVRIGSDRVCVPCIRAHMEFLASDAMRGRGSATHDELLAATYIASELRAYGIEPAGDSGGYLQRATLVRRKLTGPPQITFKDPNGASVTWNYGKEFLVSHLAQENFSAPLRQVDIDKGEPEAAPGTIVLVVGSDPKKVRKGASALGNAGTAGVIVVRKADPAYFEEAARQLPDLTIHLEGETRSALGVELNLLEVSAEAANILQELPEDTTLHFEAPSTTEESYTWNAIGMLRGSDPALRHSAVLLSAHLDHLGVGKPVNRDDIYTGADDDASGTTAVLELARVLGTGPRPQRPGVFALFGSDERTRIDVQGVGRAIGSGLGRARWLVNSRVVAHWEEGTKPYEVVSRRDVRGPPVQRPQPVDGTRDRGGAYLEPSSGFSP